ncbi:MAG TPA: FecR family protein, partial [Kofleriaceae bacterium]|nr:FecR family protein [Kofleriaceae bacterium]
MSDRKHEVEPLSEASWSRVERAIFERLDAAQPSPLAGELHRAQKRRRRLFAVGGALVAAAALVLVATNLIGRGPRGESSRIVTAGAGSHVSYGEAALDVDPQSAVLLSGNDTAGVEVVLDRGGVTCEVAPRHGRPPFTVRAGAVRVRVIGTRFSVVRDGDSGRVSVVHGTVEVTVNGQVSLVHAGERWPQTVTGGVPAAHAPAPSLPVPAAAYPAPAE